MTHVDGSALGVAAVVVTYRPDVARLQSLLAACQPQVDWIYVVDNGDGSSLAGVPVGMPRTTLICLGTNKGLAAAQNAGATAALQQGARFILLLDQDSVPAAGCVHGLVGAMQAAAASGRRVGAVGSSTVGDDGPEGFIRVGPLGYGVVRQRGGEAWIECDQVIASGCLIPAAVLLDVGLMNETLFIDKVDTEWCLRAKRRGYAIVGAPGAMLSHRLGNRHRRLWFLRWREVPIHDAPRYYYMFRNSVLVQRMPHASKRWVLAEWTYHVKLLVGVGLTGLAGRAALGAMVRGMFDGLRGASGPMPIR